MSLQATLEMLLVWGIYPLWLLAGAADYLCHRLTDIEYTSGSTESWLHLLQFFALLAAFAVAVLLEINVLTFGAMAALVVMHSVLAHVDVAYTDGRRYISPTEQQIHGFMEVLPLVAVALIGVLHWDAIAAGPKPRMFELAAPVDPERLLLLGSFVVLAGIPVVEELIRTRRHRFDQQRRYQAGLATIK